MENRRGADRFPIEREIRYKVLSRKAEIVAGIGRTLNISSNGILFTTEGDIPPGTRVEVSVNWPAQLDSRVGLKLVARGRIVRSEGNTAALEIHQYEFRTAGGGNL